MKLCKQVIVVGGGFGGLSVVKALRRQPVHVTLIDRCNHFLFQPLLYQVAMAGLAPAEIAAPIRSLLRRQSNVQVLLAEVTGADLQRQCVLTRECPPLHYDYLVLAPGAKNSYFGHEDWARIAPGLKDLDDAVEIRRRVLLSFEAAEREADPEVRRRLLTFVVIGGGPTGVELAGAIAELATYVLSRDFRSIRSDSTRVVLVEGSDRVLNTFDPVLSQKAQDSLQSMGVDVRLGRHVTKIDRLGVMIEEDRIESETVLWAAGVRASSLAEQMGLPTDRQGRVVVGADCSVPGCDDIYVIGDAASLTPVSEAQPLPGISPVAMQQGRFVAREIARRIAGKPATDFHYFDKGVMATIGRSRAVARIGNVHLSGLIAWLAWLALHIVYLIDFRNRVLVLIDWAWSYFTYQRGSRLITGRRRNAGPSQADIPPAESDLSKPKSTAALRT